MAAARSSVPAADPTSAAAPRCRLVADRRCEEPLRAIAEEYVGREEVFVDLEFLDAAELTARLAKSEPGGDLVVCLADGPTAGTPIDDLSGVRTVAWKYPSGEPVRAAPTGASPLAERLGRFLGGPTGHRLWSESAAGFTITSGASRAEAHQWVVEHRIRATYAATAERVLREIGDAPSGLCVDVGCGSGRLAVELARRSALRVVGIDIDADLRPYFERTVVEAGLGERVSFVVGDAQSLPFADDSVDFVVSRGTLPFLPDLARCFREVDRVLTPKGVALLGGRYLYTPGPDRLPRDRLEAELAASGVRGATILEGRGQWVKIVGAEAPESAAASRTGPDMLALRCIVDYGEPDGLVVLVHGGDGAMDRALERGFLTETALALRAVYPTEEVAESARRRHDTEGVSDRITCVVGRVDHLPLADGEAGLVVGVGPMLIFGDHEASMRELHRVLRRGGTALVGGRFLHMPEPRRVPGERLRDAATRTGLRRIRVLDEEGQWVEVRRGVGDGELATP